MKNYGQDGVSSELEFGKNGTKIKNEASDQMSVLQNNGIALSRMKGADPVDAQDFVTKAYLEREPDTVATGNIELGSETGSFQGQTFVVTKSGLAAPFDVLGSLHYWDVPSNDWIAVSMVDGVRISVDDTITGTDLTLEQGYLYIYDLDLNSTSGWNNIGPAATEQNLYKAVKADFTAADASSNKVIASIPAGAIIDEILVNISTACDASVAVSLATDGVIMPNTLIDEAEVGLYQADGYNEVSATQDVRIDLGALTAGAGSVMVKYKK